MTVIGGVGGGGGHRDLTRDLREMAEACAGRGRRIEHDLVAAAGIERIHRREPDVPSATAYRPATATVEDGPLSGATETRNAAAHAVGRQLRALERGEVARATSP